MRLETTIGMSDRVKHFFTFESSVCPTMKPLYRPIYEALVKHYWEE
jgi:hypothetical protein